MPPQDKITQNMFDKLGQSILDTSQITAGTQNWNPGGRSYGEKRSLWEQLGRAVWAGSESFLQQATLGAFPDALDITDVEPETFIEKVGAGIGGAAGFMLPFMLTRGMSSAAAMRIAGKQGAHRLQKKIGVKTMDDVVAARKNAMAKPGAHKVDKGTFEFDPRKFDSEEKALAYFKEGFLKGNVGRKIRHFEHGFVTQAEKQKFAKGMQGLDGGMGELAQAWGKKHGIFIDDKLMGRISNIARKHWKAADGRPVGSLADLLQARMPVLGRDTKSAAWAAALAEEAFLFSAVENSAHAVQVAYGNTPGGIEGFAKTTVHATALGFGLGLTRSIIPGGIRGGVFKFMHGGADDVNKLINKTESFAESMTTGANTKVGAKQLYKKYGNARVKSDIKPESGAGKHNREAGNRIAIGSMYRDIAKVKDNVLNNTRSKNMDGEMQHIIGKSEWAGSFQSLFKGSSGKNLSSSKLNRIVNQYQIDKYATYSREKQIAAAELMKYGLRHTGLQVRTKWRKEFIKTFRADLFGGTVGQEGQEQVIKGSLTRMFAGGTVLSLETLIHPDIPVDDKIIHFFIGAFLTKGGKELSWRNSGGRMYKWNRYEKMSSFPEHVKSLSAVNDAVGAPIWSPEWRALRDKYEIEGKDIYFDGQMIPVYLKPIKPYIETVRDKTKGKYNFLTNKEKPVFTVNEAKKVDESIYSHLYEDWRRKMAVELMLKDSSELVIPEGHRIKEWKELTSKEAQRFQKLMDKSDTLNLIDIFSRWEKATMEPAYDAFQKMGDNLIDVVQHLKVDGKMIDAVETHTKKGGEKEYRYAAIDASDLNFTKHANLHLLIQQYNAYVDIRASLGFATESSKLESVKISDKTEGLEQFGDSMSLILEDFSSSLYQFGIKKQVDFTNGIWWDMYDNYFRQKSVHSFMETLTKLSKMQRDSDSLTAKDKNAIRLLKEIVEDETGAFVKADFLETDLGGRTKDAKKERLQQNEFLRALQINWRNFKPIEYIKDTQTQSELLRAKKELIANKDVAELMEYFRDKKVTIFHSTNNNQQLRHFADFTSFMLGHQVLKSKRFVGSRDAEGNITSTKRVDSKIVSIINTLRSLRISDEKFQVSPIVDVWLRSYNELLTTKQKNQLAPYRRIEKILKEEGMTDADAKELFAVESKKLFEKNEIYQDYTKKEIELLFSSYKQLTKDTNPRDVSKNLNAVQEMIGDLLERDVKVVKYDRKLGKKITTTETVGILRQSNKIELEVMPGKIDSIFRLLSMIAKGQFDDSTRAFLKKMQDYSQHDGDVGKFAKIITNRFVSSHGDAVRLMQIAHDARTWDYRSNQLIWEKPGAFKTEESATYVVQHLRNMLQMNQNRWDESHLSIRQRIDRLERMEMNEDNNSISQLDLSTILSMDLSNKWLNTSQFTSDRHHMNSIAYTDYGFGTKTPRVKDMVKDLTDNIKKNNPDIIKNKGVDYIDGVVQKVVTDLRNAEDVPTIEYDLSNQHHMGKDTTVIQKNATYNFLKELTKDDGPLGPDTGQVFLIMSNGRNPLGRNGQLSNAETYNDLKTLLYGSQYTAHPKKATARDHSIVSAPGFSDSLIMIRTNSNKDYVWAIRNDIQIWNNVINKYAKFVESHGKDAFEEIKLATSQNPDFASKIHFNETDKKWELLEVPTDPIDGTDMIRGLALSYIRGNIKGSRFFEEGRLDLREERMAEEEVRMKLFENVSGKHIQNNDLSQYIEFWKQNKNPNGKLWMNRHGNKKLIKTLENLRDGKVKKIVVEDEGQDYVNKIFSFMEREIESLKKIQKEIEKEYIKKIKKAPGQDPDTYIKSIEDIQLQRKGTEALQKSKAWKQIDNRIDKIRQLYADKKDISIGDSMTLISDNLFNSFNLIAFGTQGRDSRDFGGIKTIMTKSNGKDKFSMYKSILQKNADFKEFFKDGIEMITFTSSSKKIGGKYGKNYKVLQMDDSNVTDLSTDNIRSFIKDSLNPENTKNYTETINIQDVQFIYQKGPKDKAAIAPNFDVGVISKKGQQEFYDMFTDAAMRQASRESGDLTKPLHMSETIAKWKRAVQGENSPYNADVSLDQTNQGVMHLLARNNAHPLMLGKQGLEILYKDIFDRVQNPRVPGAQSVYAFDMFNELRSTIKLDGKIWQVGEILAPKSLGDIEYQNKDFRQEFLTFVKKNKDTADEFIHASDVKAMNDHGITFSTGKKLSDLVKHIQSTKGDDYGVMIWNHREPHVKDASVVPLIIKRFNKKGNGNQVVVNALDGIEHLELDFDGDVGNIFMHMPKNTARDLIKLSGKSGKTDVFQHIESPAYKGIELKDDASMSRFAGRQDLASKLRGTSMIMQHMAKWFRFYNSPTAFKWKEWDGKKAVDSDGGILVKIANNEYLGVRKDWDADVALSRYIQTSVDTGKGKWDTRKLSNAKNVMEDVLFNEEFGLFVRKRPMEIETETDTIIGEDTRIKLSKGELVLRENPSEISTTTRQTIMKLVNIRKRFLGQRHSQYDARGDKRKVSYQDKVFNISNYIYELKRFQSNDLVKALKEEGGIRQQDNIFEGFIEATDLSNGRDPSHFENIDRTEFLMTKQIMPWWNHYNKDNPHHNIRYKDFIDNLVELDSPSFDIMAADPFKEFNIILSDVSKQGKFIEMTHDFIQMLEAKVLKISNPTNSSGLYYRRTINRLQRKLDFYTNKYSEFLKDKKNWELDPKVKKFIDNIKDELKHKVTAQHYEESGTYLTGKELDAKVNIAIENLDFRVKAVHNRSMMDAITITRAYSNVALSNPEILGMTPELHLEMNKQVEVFKKDFNKAIENFRKGEPVQLQRKVQGEFAEKYNVPSIDYIYANFIARYHNEIIQKYGGGEGWESKNTYQMTQLLLVKLMVPEASLKEFASYKGELYPAPKYDNFHHFVKLGFRVLNEYFPQRAADEIAKPFIREYKEEVLRQNNLIPSREQKIEDYNRRNKVDTDQFGAPNPLSYGYGHNSKDLLEIMVPAAASLYGKPMSQLDAYQSNFLLFGSGVMPHVLNSSRFTTLPYKTFVDASRWNGEDYSIGGPSSLFKAMEERSTNFLVHDKWRRSYARVLGDNDFSTDSKPYSNFSKPSNFSDRGDDKFDKNIEVDLKNKDNKEEDCAG